MFTLWYFEAAGVLLRSLLCHAWFFTQTALESMQQRLLRSQRSDRDYLERSSLALGQERWTFLPCFL